MRIGVDLDGVVYDFTEAITTYLIEEVGLDPEDLPGPTVWDYHEPWGMTREQFVRHCNNAVDHGTLFGTGVPTPTSVDALRFLKGQGHTVHIVTARGFGTAGGSERLTREWLDAYQIPFDSLTFSSDKTIVRTDCFIEDKPANFDALEAAGVDVYLMDQPYNQEHPTDKRVYSVMEFAIRVGERTTREQAGNAGTGEVRTVSATGGEKGVKPARFDLIPAGPLWTVAELYGYGAAKYADRNWEAGYEWSKSFGAMQRHAWEFWNGVDTDDPEIGGSGLPHLASVVFHAFALMEWARTHPEFDDRPSTKARAEWREISNESYGELVESLRRMAQQCAVPADYLTPSY